MTIQEYFKDWSDVMDLQEADRILRKLSASPHTVCPRIKDVFRAFALCPLKSLRVVVCGQDPYPTLKSSVLDGSPVKTPVATGLAFANTADTREEAFSPSLNILRESVIDFTIPHGPVNFDPTLEKWERQGVLMLNTALSCEAGKAGSHSLLWRPFMKSLLTSLSKYAPGIVYVLMGSQAQSLEAYINKGMNHILKIRHPSYYARTKTRMPSDIWKQVNSILIGQNDYGINWFENK